MSKKNIRNLGTLIPSSVMLLITILSFSDSFYKMIGLTDLDMKGLIISGLVIIFPIAFLIEGVLSAIRNISWIIPLVVSLMVFLIIMLVYLNSSASVYLIYYFIVYILGYVITKSILKYRSSKIK